MTYLFLISNATHTPHNNYRLRRNAHIINALPYHYGVSIGGNEHTLDLQSKFAMQYVQTRYQCSEQNDAFRRACRVIYILQYLSVALLRHLHYHYVQRHFAERRRARNLSVRSARKFIRIRGKRLLPRARHVRLHACDTCRQVKNREG